MKKLECDCDPAICKDVVCSMVPVRRSFIRFSFGTTPLEPAERLWIRLMVVAKTTRKSTSPAQTMVDTTQDICQVMANEGTALTFIRSVTALMVETDKKQFEKLMHSCPYEVCEDS
jgi:hypothetical protein